MLPTQVPYQNYVDLNGDPLDEGSIYYGVANANPVTSPIAVYWDFAGTQPAAQPIKTLAGYPVRFGTPANVYASASSYSISVYDKKGRLVYTAPDAEQYNVFSLLADTDDHAKGAGMVGYKLPGMGTVGRTVASKLDDVVNCADFGFSTTATGAQNLAALQAAVFYAKARGGCEIVMDAGTFPISGTVDISAMHNTKLTGSGMEATILLQSDPVAPTFSSASDSRYRSFEDFSIAHAVTRTAGSYVMSFTALERRSLLRRVRISGHAHAINMAAFEQVSINACNIVSPSNAGTAIICGKAAGSNQGANLLITDCFLRGCDDLVYATNVLGTVGVQVYDVEAVFMVNTDISAFVNSSMVVSPQTRAANCHFVQCFFDITQLDHNVVFGGAGTKFQFSFTGCWVASAGSLAPTSLDACGVRYTATGTYEDHIWSGTRFFTNMGAGALIECLDPQIVFTGCSFYGNGKGQNTYRSGVVFAPNGGSNQNHGAVFTGCRFGNNDQSDMFFGKGSAGNVLTGNLFQKGLTWTATLSDSVAYGGAGGNADNGSPRQGVSALQNRIAPTVDMFAFTAGSVTFNEIKPTYNGHMLTLWNTTGGNLTAAVGGNLGLAGAVNYVMPNTARLTLRYYNGNWQEVSRSA